MMMRRPAFMFTLLTTVAAQAAFNDQPPANDSATQPYWPHYPEGTSPEDFKMNENPTDVDLRGESRIAQWIVVASNVWRAQFGSQQVTWNETAARVANDHTQTCRWEHWGSDNLAQLSFSLPNERFDVNPMIEMWAVEWDYYPFRHPEAQAYSHFTAMTWNDSNTLGCAWNVNCGDSDEFPSKTFFVCNYWPQGNIGTQPPGRLYAENVGNWTKWSPEQVPDVPFTAASGPTEAIQATTVSSTSRPSGVSAGSADRNDATTTSRSSFSSSSAGPMAPVRTNSADMTVVHTTLVVACLTCVVLLA